MTLHPPALDTRVELRWLSPADGLWVADRRGEYAGMVERLDGAYHARSARGRALGSYEDLGSARAVVDCGLQAPPSAPRGNTRIRAVAWTVNAAAVLTALACAFAVLR